MQSIYILDVCSLGIIASKEFRCWSKSFYRQFRPWNWWEITLWYIQCLRCDSSNSKGNFDTSVSVFLLQYNSKRARWQKSPFSCL